MTTHDSVHRHLHGAAWPEPAGGPWSQGFLGRCPGECSPPASAWSAGRAPQGMRAGGWAAPLAACGPISGRAQHLTSAECSLQRPRPGRRLALTVCDRAPWGEGGLGVHVACALNHIKQGSSLKASGINFATQVRPCRRGLGGCSRQSCLAQGADVPSLLWVASRGRRERGSRPLPWKPACALGSPG